jgi:hypothetical protein
MPNGAAQAVSVYAALYSDDLKNDGSIQGRIAQISLSTFHRRAVLTSEITSVTPSTIAANDDQQMLAVSWTVPLGGNGPTPDELSRVAATFRAGSAQYPATDATKIADNSTASAHVSTLQVRPPANMAAGTYGLFLSLPRLGNSNAINVSVAYTVTEISPPTSSLAGGLRVTIFGTGFAQIPAAVKVSIGGSPCDVVSARSTAIECITPRGAPGAAAVAVAPSPHVGLETAPGLQFQFVAAPVVTGVSPPRGSTAGGTPVVISGTGLTADVVSVAMGGTPCAGVQFVSSTEVRCAVWAALGQKQAFEWANTPAS